MIKVRVESRAYGGAFASKTIHLRGMRNWCREQFGKNPTSGPRIWMSTVESDYEPDTQPPTPSWLRWQHRIHVPVFYFIDQRHATAFLLRWG